MNRAKVPGEMMEDAIIWTRFLENVVPVARLVESFDLASEKQTSSFAPNYFDVKNAWKEIEATEFQSRSEAEKARQSNRNPVENCPEKSRHMNPHGEVLICDPLNWNNEIALPCKICRPAAYEAQRENYIAKNKGKIANPVEVADSGKDLSKIEFGAGDKRIYINENDPVEVLNCRKDEISRKMVAAIGTADYDLLHGEWLQIVDQLRIVREKDGE